MSLEGHSSLGVSNLRQYIMVMNPARLGHEKDCAERLGNNANYSAILSSERESRNNKPSTDNIKYLVMGPRWVLDIQERLAV
jgi:hypothetical protein